MTKSELKGIIMECIDELQLESVDEDQAIIEQEEVVAEACYNMLMESVSGFSDPDDPDYIDRFFIMKYHMTSVVTSIEKMIKF